MNLPKVGGGYLVEDVSFDIRAGEILGLYGLMGAGRTELVECIMGHHKESRGTTVIDGKELKPKTNKEQILKGLGHIPEDRQGEGLVQTMSIEKNLTLASLEEYFKKFTIDKKLERSRVDEMIETLYIKAGNPKNSIMSLSGGNQQKIVIGKWILTRPKVLFMDEPTRGIDVGAKEDVFKIMNELAMEGIGIVFVGSDLKEVVSIADRIIVMSNGQMTGEFVSDEINEQNLVNASYAGH